MKSEGDRHRRSLRLEGYDYSQAGAYFVTMVTRNRECLFGEIVDGEMRPSEFGGIVAEEWARSAAVRAEIELDSWVVMPNHLHAIVMVKGDGHGQGIVGATGRSEGDRRTGATGRSPLQGSVRAGPRPGSLGALIAGFKASATKRVNKARGTPAEPVWQRNYYEHVIRSDEELDRVRRYIEGNPARWELDRENPNVVAGTRRIGRGR